MKSIIFFNILISPGLIPNTELFQVSLLLQLSFHSETSHLQKLFCFSHPSHPLFLSSFSSSFPCVCSKFMWTSMLKFHICFPLGPLFLCMCVFFCWNVIGLDNSLLGKLKQIILSLEE